MYEEQFVVVGARTKNGRFCIFLSFSIMQCTPICYKVNQNVHICVVKILMLAPMHLPLKNALLVPILSIFL